jgi:hypothetical protein
MPQRIGIDLDGVLIDHTANKLAVAERLGYALEPWQTNSNLLRTSLSQEHYAALLEDVYTKMTASAPPVDGALEHLAALPGELYLVSARRLKSVRYAQQWLMRHGVFDIIPAERIFFCESKKDKRPICDRLGIKTFVDDQLEVLELLSPRMKRVLLDAHGISSRLNIEEGYYVAPDWSGVRNLIGQ